MRLILLMFLATLRPARPGGDGRDRQTAAKVDAGFGLGGDIHQISNAILALTVPLRAVPSGEPVKGGGVEIWGNTNDTWRFGTRFILNNRIFRQDQ